MFASTIGSFFALAALISQAAGQNTISFGNLGGQELTFCWYPAAGQPAVTGGTMYVYLLLLILHLFLIAGSCETCGISADPSSCQRSRTRLRMPYSRAARKYPLRPPPPRTRSWTSCAVWADIKWRMVPWWGRCWCLLSMSW